MLRQKMINFIYMYIWESNKESILAYMDYINDFFFHIGIPLPYLTLVLLRVFPKHIFLRGGGGCCNPPSGLSILKVI